MDETEKFYSELGAKGLSALARRYKIDDDLEFLKKFLKKSDKSLDLACGYGRTAIPLLKAGYDIYGVDIIPVLIREVQSRALGLSIDKKRFRIGDMRRLPYKAKTFTKVFCMWNSFNDILSESDQVRVFNEIYRVLSPGGTAFLTTLDGEKKPIQEVQK